MASMPCDHQATPSKKSKKHKKKKSKTPTPYIPGLTPKPGDNKLCLSNVTAVDKPDTSSKSSEPVKSHSTDHEVQQGNNSSEKHESSSYRTSGSRGGESTEHSRQHHERLTEKSGSSSTGSWSRPNTETQYKYTEQTKQHDNRQTEKSGSSSASSWRRGNTDTRYEFTDQHHDNRMSNRQHPGGYNDGYSGHDNRGSQYQQRHQSGRHGHHHQDRQPSGHHQRQDWGREQEPQYSVFGDDSSFSLTHPCLFTVDGVKYKSLEHYVLHQKAVFFRRDDLAKEIVGIEDLDKLKRLEQRMKNANGKPLKMTNPDIMEIGRVGNSARVSQNEDLRTKLLKTVHVLVYASPDDHVWSIGLTADDSRAKNRKAWKGGNLLGKILTKLRAQHQYTFFWGYENPFSQHHYSKFVIDGKEYDHAEQYMMHQKAVVFGDYEIADKIMRTSDPKAQKSLGRQVANFDERIWKTECKDIVKRANIAKFSQNPDMKRDLMSTGYTTLVEASPFDKIWGIGLSEDDPRAWCESTWKGYNQLGKIITEVREYFRKQDSDKGGKQEGQSSTKESKNIHQQPETKKKGPNSKKSKPNEESDSNEKDNNQTDVTIKQETERSTEANTEPQIGVQVETGTNKELQKGTKGDTSDQENEVEEKKQVIKLNRNFKSSQDPKDEPNVNDDHSKVNSETSKMDVSTEDGGTKTDCPSNDLNVAEMDIST